MILAGLAVAFSIVSGVSMFADVPGKIDPWIHTEAEAVEEHHIITMAAEQQEQTQAGFNAYTLKAIMQQEIQILMLQIEVEDDVEASLLLKEELALKRSFIQRLEAEERRQLLRGRQL